MNKTTTRIVVVCCCVAFAAAAAQAQDQVIPAGSSLPREVATGSFSCSVLTVDPPVGTGIPRGGAYVIFKGTAGITDRDLTESVNLGEGQGSEQECQTLSAQMRSAAQALRCMPGPIRFRDLVGGNFTEKDWSFDVVCTDSRDHVMNAIGTLLAEIITTPFADEVIQMTSTTDFKEFNRE